METRPPGSEGGPRRRTEGDLGTAPRSDPYAFDEDRHQLRATSSPARALATLRNLAISLIRLAGSNRIAATMRWIARRPERSAQMLGAMPA